MAACFALASNGCSSDDGTETTPTGQGGGTATGTAAGGTGGTGGTGGSVSGNCDPDTVACEAEVSAALNLQGESAPGLIANEADGSGWISAIDATAGGFGAPDPHSYVYGRFTDEGLEKVLISDTQSLTSMDWDIGFQRFIIRINSGNSGPSCVSRAQLAGPPEYDTVTEVPTGLTYSEDEYFTPNCTMIEDGAGLESPATVLGGYWTYTDNHCLQMTENVYVLQLPSGRHIKLEVTHYYLADAQEDCNTTGSVDPATAGSANIRIRWAFLD
ncbi:MAG: hypothetical protein JRI23_08440 [Deltaproteobacteria bacterium]|nr:hypothetical protein [Deltaproteobacteria bacterium]